MNTDPQHDPERGCGNCRHFDHEDFDGFGWCALLCVEKRCSSRCVFHNYNQPE